VLFTVSHTIIVLCLFRQTNRETMNSYFSTLDIIVNKRKVSNRICLMIQDLVDLRKTEWEKPRRVDNNPETINQIHNPQFKGLMGSMNPLSRNSKIDRRGGDFQNWKPSRKFTYLYLLKCE
jgi:hypothetical protein